MNTRNLTQQLELGLARSRRVRQPSPPPRAAWWIQQMRKAVSEAIEWQPVPEARPEQVWFRLPARRRASCQ
jgi:hypothetical protein